jgi:chromosome segregation ATPase
MVYRTPLPQLILCITDTVESLRASFQAKEKDWERARLALEARISTLADQSTAAKRALDLEKKLTQAGSHLKTLAQENARLNKLQQVTDQAKLNQEKDESRLKESEKAIEQLKTTLAESEKRQSKILKEKDDVIQRLDKELQTLRDEQQQSHQTELEKLRADNQTYAEELEKIKTNNQAYVNELDKLKAEKQASVESVHNLEQEIEKLRSAVAAANEKDTEPNGVDTNNDSVEELKEAFQARELELMNLVQALDTLANSKESVVEHQLELPTTPLLAKIKDLEALVEANTTSNEKSSDANNSNGKLPLTVNFVYALDCPCLPPPAPQADPY